MERLKKLIIKHRFDYVGLTEVNKDWRRIEHENTIWGATTGWKQNRRVQVAQNTTKASSQSELLIGGVATMVFDDLVFRISSQENDFRKLGRWCSFTITGKNNVNTTIFTCYCPVRGRSIGSAFAQQLIYIAEHKDQIPTTNCPRQLFGIDLHQAITKKLDQGHNLIVMGDFNSEYSNLKRWMQDLGLVDLMEQKHGACPKTHIRSKDAPIDCIFGSVDLAVNQGGFLSFSKLLSDHRGVWVDIPKFLIYGYNPPKPTFPSARRLKLVDPRVVKKYDTILLDLMHQHDLFYRMEYLHKQTTFKWTTCMAKEYEEIDKTVGTLMDYAEKNCRKLHTGTVPWSPTYKKSCTTLLYWLMRKTYFNGLHNNVRQLIVLQRKANIVYDPTLTLQSITLNIKRAYKERKKCMQFAESLTLEYRTQLALAKEEAGEIKAANFLRNMNHVEAQRRLFRNIRHMEGKIKGGCTAKVIQTQDDIEVEFTKKHDIEQLCATRNEQLYHQTEINPSDLLSHDIIEDLGNHGEGPQIHQVLKGIYVAPDGTSPETSDFLNTCKLDQSAYLLNTPQNIAERYKTHIAAWKIRKESTCTYHHHIGHYKAALRQKDLSWFFFQRSDIPEMTGYSPYRHRECVDLMIMKKTNCFDIKKQRTLGILDTEFNQSNKKIGKEGMDNAINLGKLAPEQFAVKNTSALEQIVFKRCIIDHHQTKRKCLALTSSDLASCYDRIIHTAAALALLRVGIPHQKINSMFSSIQRMVHRIRTMYGDSDITYGGDEIGDWNNYPQGVLQGNACGPTIWVLISSIIFEILHKRGFAVEICTSISKHIFYMVGFAYVDDSDLIQSGSDPLEVLSSMQELLNNWCSLMGVTGGAISVEKSWWYLLEYVWKRGKWVAADAGMDLDLVATSTQGEIVSLKRLHANEASKMLGVWVAPDGNRKKSLHEQRKAALEWGCKVKMGHSSQLEAWQALHSNITAKLKYPLPACSYTEEECKSILYPALKAALPKAGLASNLVTEVRDGPLELGGAGILSLYHQEGTACTTMVVDQIFKQTSTGKMFSTCIEDLVLEAGLYGTIWKMDFDKIAKYISHHSLIYNMLHYNFLHDIQISPKHGQIDPQRNGDSSIMSLASQFYSDHSTLKAIQRVRMAFGVIHLSDVCSVHGKVLDKRFLQTEPGIIHKNKYDWPSKHHTTRYDMSKWRNLMRKIFSFNSLFLPYTLGTWIPMSQEQWVDNWDYFVTKDKQFLFEQKHGEWQRHLLKPHSRRSYYTEHLDSDNPVHFELLRATVKVTSSYLLVLATSHRLPINTSTTSYLTFGSIQIQSSPLDWFNHSMSSSFFTTHLLTHLILGTAVAVSDGSYFPLNKVGACSWSISTPDGLEWIKGGGVVPGDPNSQSSYRSELYGLLGIASVLSNVTLPLSSKTQITVACDGLAALQNVQLEKKVIKPKQTDVDLISMITSLWNQSTFSPNKVHVYGHQDNTGKQLTNLEKINCDRDSDAKAIARSQIDGTKPPQTHTPTDLGFGTITCGSTLVTSNIQSTLYKNVTHAIMLKWLSCNGEDTCDLTSIKVDWKPFTAARKEVTLQIQLFVTKWLSGDTATGRVMCRRKQRNTSFCPRCGQDDEHLLHVVTCPSPIAAQLRLKLLEDLKLWFKSRHTHPDITSFFIIGLTKWFTDKGHFWQANSEIFSDDNNTNCALRSQLKISWYYMLCGMITEKITLRQQIFYHEISSQKSAQRWATDLIKQLWQFLHALWLQRNEALHKEASIYKLSRVAILKTSITTEYNYGLNSLPQNYSSYFHLPLTTLLNKPSKYLKRWFLLIRSARESSIDAFPQDIFSQKGPLRTWVKLSNKT